MEPIISLAGFAVVVLLALYFAGIYFNTKYMLLKKLKDEQAARAELNNTFAGLQEQYQIICLESKRLEADARAIAQDRDKAYDKVAYLKTSLQAEIDIRKGMQEKSQTLRDEIEAIETLLDNRTKALAEIAVFAGDVKPRGTISKANYSRLQVALDNARNSLERHLQQRVRDEKGGEA